MAGAETAIQKPNGKATGVSITEFMNTMDAQGATIINTIFTNAADRENFNKFLDAYKSGQYLITCDWTTEGGVAANEFVAKTTAAGQTPTANVKYEDGRGFSYNRPGNFNAINTSLTNTMRGQIATALGLGSEANAGKMADALVLQLGQDREELRAVMTDITKEQTSASY
ncbi:hypothetical protein [Treponema primitia]|uniref:hypothetical protein n=1 Tax=Treponema primitia TaxID=88058 RepID=UPI0005A248FC|nr:hypothetical protein [Treponema primitia]